MSVFGWDLPAGVDPNDPHLTGDWPCPECGKSILDDEGHCRLCGYTEDLDEEGDQ